MKRRKIPLTENQRKELEKGYKEDKSARFRQRCHIILLKSQDRTAKDIASIVNLNTKTIYHWLNKYEEQGITGLRTQQGQGRKPILKESEAEIIKETIQQERQRLKIAHEDLQIKLGKSFSKNTLKRFLKNLAVATKE